MPDSDQRLIFPNPGSGGVVLALAAFGRIQRDAAAGAAALNLPNNGNPGPFPIPPNVRALTRGADAAVPLSPDQFPDPLAAQGVVLSTQPQTLTGSELATLKGAQTKLKGLRRDLSSADLKVRSTAGVQILFLVGYLIGLFDGKGIRAAQTTSTNSLGRVFGDYGKPTVSDDLDSLEQVLDSIIKDAESTTRRFALGIQLGEILIGIGTSLIAAGIGLAFVPP